MTDVKAIGRDHIARAVILAIAIASLTGIGCIQAERAKRHAATVLAKILDYQSRYGVYPGELSEIGFSTTEEKNRFGLYYNGMKTDPPVFLYRSTVIPFDNYWYDFELATWEIQPG